MNIKSFIFLDCETTGLPQFENKTKITELCFVSVQTEHILLGVYPRVQNKLNICFNPGKYITTDAERITGLSNDLLEYESSFDNTSFNLLLNFMDRLSKPVCFIAHNGNCFDFPILKKHFEILNKVLPDYVYCADSLIAFRQLSLQTPPKQLTTSNIESAQTNLLDDEWDELLLNETIAAELLISPTDSKIPIDIQKFNETTPAKKTNNKFVPRKQRNKQIESTVAKKRLNFDEATDMQKKKSFKLSDVYRRFLQKEPSLAHHAEGDVMMLLECAIHLGDPFVEWTNKNAIPFANVNSLNMCNPVRS